MRRTPFLGLLAAALSLPLDGVRADGCPPIVFGAAHESLDELAAQTLHDLFDQGGRYESGGFLIQQNGAYYASRPVTQRARRAVNYCIVLPRDARLAGLYHTHVVSSALSVRDRGNAVRAGVPSYIGTIGDRSLLVYDARRRDVRLIESAPRGQLAKSGPPAHDRHRAGTGESRSMGERFATLTRRAADRLVELLEFF